MRASVDLIDLRNALTSNSIPSDAPHMKAYMKGHFDFIGIKSIARRKTAAPHIQNWLASKELNRELVRELWDCDEREMQYVAMDYLGRAKRFWQKEDLEFFKDLIEKKSWWDTVDFLAATCVGGVIKKFPELENEMDKWNQSENIWIIRASILYQLKYKGDMDLVRLSRFILFHADSKEFFIQKAAGWILRQCAKFKPDWVASFVAQNELAPLTRREALKHIA